MNGGPKLGSPERALNVTLWVDASDNLLQESTGFMLSEHVALIKGNWFPAYQYGSCHRIACV